MNTRNMNPQTAALKSGSVGRGAVGSSGFDSYEARIPSPWDQRHAAICCAAYHIAQRRGFAPGRELEDWLEAERAFDTPARAQEAASGERSGNLPAAPCAVNAAAAQPPPFGDSSRYQDRRAIPHEAKAQTSPKAA